MMNLEMCKECGSGNTNYDSEYNRFHCDNCSNTAPDAFGESRDKAVKLWNDHNIQITIDPDQLLSATVQELEELTAENEELKADIIMTVIESGEVLKHHTELMAHIESLHRTLGETIQSLLNQDSHPSVIDKAEAVMKRTPLQSLNIVEACAVRKAATILCMNEAGKTMVSHTALNKYADQLELG